jgi:hypothetical protein
MVPPGAPPALSETTRPRRRGKEARQMADRTRGPKTKTYPEKRVCVGKKCSVVLSMYNKDDICDLCLKAIPLNERPYRYNDGF